MQGHATACLGTKNGDGKAKKTGNETDCPRSNAPRPSWLASELVCATGFHEDREHARQKKTSNAKDGNALVRLDERRRSRARNQATKRTLTRPRACVPPSKKIKEQTCDDQVQSPRPRVARTTKWGMRTGISMKNMLDQARKRTPTRLQACAPRRRRAKDGRATQWPEQCKREIERG